MMKKTILIGALLCGMVSVSSAQSTDPKAKVVLDGVSKKFKSLTSVVANFILKVEGANNKVSDTKKGTVFLKGAKYKVALDGQEIISDNKTSWTYSKDVNEVTINTVDQSSAAMTPAKLFTNFYDKDYLYRMEGETTEKGKVLQNIELTPTDKSKSMFKVLVSIDKKSQTIARMKMFEKNGNKVTYEITNFTPNAAVTEGTFTFDAKKYPGGEVVDLR
jgi:outer membrane lipoprotein carrier protein